MVASKRKQLLVFDQLLCRTDAKLVAVRQRTPRSTKPAKRRTTLTLPADCLKQAERIARVGKVTVSTVVSEALSEGLQRYTAADRSEAVLRAYKKAFSGFSEEEMSILNGVMLEPTGGR